jgi:hypothetical protein
MRSDEAVYVKRSDAGVGAPLTVETAGTLRFGDPQVGALGLGDESCDVSFLEARACIGQSRHRLLLRSLRARGGSAIRCSATRKGQDCTLRASGRNCSRVAARVIDRGHVPRHTSRDV